jgi:hypothetical protein
MQAHTHNVVQQLAIPTLFLMEKNKGDGRMEPDGWSVLLSEIGMDNMGWDWKEMEGWEGGLLQFRLQIRRVASLG